MYIIHISPELRSPLAEDSENVVFVEWRVVHDVVGGDVAVLTDVVKDGFQILHLHAVDVRTVDVFAELAHRRRAVNADYRPDEHSNPVTARQVVFLKGTSIN